MIVDVSENTSKNIMSTHAEILPNVKRPKFIHTTLKSAEDEIIRLQTKYPDSEFYLLTASHYMRKNTAGLFELVETLQNFLSLRAR